MVTIEFLAGNVLSNGAVLLRRNISIAVLKATAFAYIDLHLIIKFTALHYVIYTRNSLCATVFLHKDRMQFTLFSYNIFYYGNRSSPNLFFRNLICELNKLK